MTGSAHISHSAASIPLFESAHSHLERVRLRILTEIRATPTPIPHCDQHFNRLLEWRNQVAEDLRALETAAAQGDTGGEALAALVGEVSRRAMYLSDAERADLLDAIAH